MSSLYLAKTTYNVRGRNITSLIAVLYKENYALTLFVKKPTVSTSCLSSKTVLQKKCRTLANVILLRAQTFSDNGS